MHYCIGYILIGSVVHEWHDGDGSNQLRLKIVRLTNIYFFWLNWLTTTDDTWYHQHPKQQNYIDLLIPELHYV